MEIREVTYLAIAIRVFFAVLLGGILGLERGLKNRPAGLRTYMLVCVGACLTMLTNQYIFQVFGTGDPVRMGAQVISGIGFLGAGTIIVTRRSQIKGLTTAAGLWTAAGVGLALGVGFYEAAVLGSIAVFLILTVLQRMDTSMHRKTRHLDVYIEVSAQISLGELARSVRSVGLELSDVKQEQVGSASPDGSRAYAATLNTPRRQTHQALLDTVQAIPGVIYLEEL